MSMLDAICVASIKMYLNSIQIGPGSLASFDVYLPIKKSYYTFVFNGVCHISYFVTKGYCF